MYVVPPVTKTKTIYTDSKTTVVIHNQVFVISRYLALWITDMSDAEIFGQCSNDIIQGLMLLRHKRCLTLESLGRDRRKTRNLINIHEHNPPRHWQITARILMLDMLQDRDWMGLKPQARETHGLPARIMQLLCLQIHLWYEVLLSAEVRNERYQR